MLRHGIIRDPRTTVEIRGIRFDWPDPHSCQILLRSDKKCARYPLWKYFAPRKISLKFTLGQQICHKSIGRTRISIDTL